MTNKQEMPTTKKDKIALVKALEGLEVQTHYGPSDVLGLVENNTYVLLAEFGEEEYVVKLDYFIEMYFECN